MRESAVARAHRQFMGERNNYIIPKPYVTLVDGDYVAAMVLREIAYWSGDWADTIEKDGWFYRNEEDWEEATHLSRKQVNRSIVTINKAAEGELVEKRISKVRTSTGTVLNETATYYRLNPDMYERLFGGGNSGNGPSGNSGNDDDPEGDSGNVQSGSSGDTPSGNSLTYAQENVTRVQHKNSAPADADRAAVVPAVPEPAENSRTAKQREADRKYERSVALYAAYCRGIDLDPDGDAAAVYRDRAFRELKPIVDKVVPTADDFEACTRWMNLQAWRDEPPKVTQVIGSFAGWCSKGKPATPSTSQPATAAKRPAGQRGYSADELMQMGMRKRRQQ